MPIGEWFEGYLLLTNDHKSFDLYTCFLLGLDTNPPQCGTSPGATVVCIYIITHNHAQSIGGIA